jgi:hypothetical protein
MFAEVSKVINVFEPKQHNIRLVISADYHYSLFGISRHSRDATDIISGRILRFYFIIRYPVALLFI